MIVQALHRQPVGLDTNVHRQLKLRLPLQDWARTSKINALFVSVNEFADACREFPVVFVKAGQDEKGVDVIAPIAIFGVAQDDNLFVTAGRWRARYMPTMMRLYPFCMAQMDETRLAVCVDTACENLNETEGEPLFDAQAKPSELLKKVQDQLEDFEGEVQRTRTVCKRFQELGLFKDMRFEATLPGDRKHTVDGFLVIDEDKLRALPDADVLEMHRNGVAGLVHLHWMSMRNLQGLLEWHVERTAGSADAAPTTPMPLQDKPDATPAG